MDLHMRDKTVDLQKLNGIDGIETTMQACRVEPLVGPRKPAQWYAHYSSGEKMTLPVMCEGLQTSRDRFHDIKEALQTALAARNVLHGVSYFDHKVKMEKRAACEEVVSMFPQLFGRAPEKWIEKAMNTLALNIKDHAVKRNHHNPKEKVPPGSLSGEGIDPINLSSRMTDYSDTPEVLVKTENGDNERSSAIPHPGSVSGESAARAQPSHGLISSPPRQRTAPRRVRLKHCTIFASPEISSSDQRKPHLWCRANQKAWDGKNQTRLCNSFVAFRLALAQQTGFDAENGEVLYSGLLVSNNFEFRAAMCEAASLGQVRICFQTR